MKIGILTYHTPNNFGANLQAYSSSHYFASLGHNVKIINYLMDGNNYNFINSPQSNAHWSFSQNTLNVTRPCLSGKDIYEVVKEENIELVIVGSDAVWNNGDFELLKIYSCDWLKGTELEDKVKIAAMSPACMGNSYGNLNDEERNSFKYNLEKFSYLCCRDEWTRSIINRDIFKDEIIKIINPDPAFFLNDYVHEDWSHPNNICENDYILISINSNVTNKGLISVMRKLWLTNLKRIAHKHKLFVVELPLPDGTSGLHFDYTVPYPIDPLQWYLWIRNSAGFFGYRFHAIVSCLSSGKPFLSLDGYGLMPKWSRVLNLIGIRKFDHKVAKNSKIRNLLDGSGLESWRINTTEICFISPREIMRKLLYFNTKKSKEYCKKCKIEFANNMSEMLNIVTK